MIKARMNSPIASSCGRLFDAVAAALGLCFDRQSYEGEAAAHLETIVCHKTLADEGDHLAYPMPIPNLKGANLPYIEPLAMWNAVLGDLVLRTSAGVISARFHKGLAKAIASMALKLSRRGDNELPRFDTIALSGGCFQNRVLFEQVVGRLEALDFKVLTHSRFPANDGGISLGQAAVAAARLIACDEQRQKAS